MDIGENQVSHQDWSRTMSGVAVLEYRNPLQVATNSGALLKRRVSLHKGLSTKLDDVIVQCPKCKALETLQFAAGTLTPCRKFSQREGMTYHDCGSDLPCRLHR